MFRRGKGRRKKENEFDKGLKCNGQQEDGPLTNGIQNGGRKARREYSRRTWAGGKRRDEGHEHEDGELLHVDDLGVQAQVEDNQLHQTSCCV